MQKQKVHYMVDEFSSTMSNVMPVVKGNVQGTRVRNLAATCVGVDEFLDVRHE